MKLTHILTSSALLSSMLFAGGDIIPVNPIVENVPIEESAWSFELEPYMLIASMSGNAKVGRTPALEIDVDFGTILENLDIGAMVHFEAMNQNGWGIWIDYGFMDLSSDITGPIGGVTNASVRQGTLEAFGMYRQALNNGHIDYLAGIRWWDNDFDITHNSLPVDIAVEEDWVDLVVGAR